MMDEVSAGGEPDVSAIDLSSHSSGRRRRRSISAQSALICAHIESHCKQ